MTHVSGDKQAVIPSQARLACAILCVCLAVIAQTYLARTPLLMQGKWLYVLAVVLAWWALGDRAPDVSFSACPDPRSVPFRRMAPFLAVAAGIDAVAFVYAMREQTARDALVFWLLALALALATLLAFCVAPHVNRAWVRSLHWPSRSRCAEVTVLLAILVLAAYLRLFDIERIPPFINLDEGNDGIQAVGIVDGTMRNVFAMGMGSMTRLSTLPASLVMSVWRADLVGLRVSMALVGVAALPFLYVLARMYLSVPFAMLAVFLLAVAPANIFFSRYGVPNIEAAILTVAFVLCLLRALGRRSSGDALACGIVGGIAVYSFHSNRVFAVIAVLMLLFMLIKDWRRWRSYGKLGVIILATVIFVGAPQLGFYVANPRTVLGHTAAHVWLTDPDIRASKNPDEALNVLGTRMTDRAFWGFNTYADSSEHFSRGRLLDPLTGILFMIGLGVCLRKQGDPGYAALGSTYLAFVVVLGVLILVPPDAGRMQGLIPLLCLMAGIALQSLWSLLGGVHRALRVAAGAAVFVVLPVLALIINYDYFFNQWIPSRRYDDLRSDVARWVATEDVTPFAVRGDFSPNDAQFRFMAPGKQGYMMLAWEDYLPVRQQLERDAAFIFMESALPTVDVLRSYYPDGVFEEHRSAAGRLLFASYRVSRSDIAAYQGLDAVYSSPGSADSVRRRDRTLVFNWAQDRSDGIGESLSAAWSGSVFVPEYGAWRLRLEGSGDAGLMLDGAAVVSKKSAETGADAQMTLARGWHELRVTQSTSGGSLRLMWAFSGRPLEPVGAEYLSFVPVVHGLRGAYFAGTSVAGAPALQTVEPVFFNRVNAFTQRAGGQPVSVLWTGSLNAAADGVYRFAARAFDGVFTLKIDGQTVVSIETGVQEARESPVTLNQGQHRIEMSFISVRGVTDILQLWWAPPGQEQLSVLPAGVLTPVQR